MTDNNKEGAEQRRQRMAEQRNDKQEQGENNMEPEPETTSKENETIMEEMGIADKKLIEVCRQQDRRAANRSNFIHRIKEFKEQLIYLKNAIYEAKIYDACERKILTKLTTRLTSARSRLQTARVLGIFMLFSYIKTFPVCY